MTRYDDYVRTHASSFFARVFVCRPFVLSFVRSFVSFRFVREREIVVGAKRRSASSYRIDSTPWMGGWRINFIGDRIHCVRERGILLIHPCELYVIR